VARETKAKKYPPSQEKKSIPAIFIIFFTVGICIIKTNFHLLWQARRKRTNNERSKKNLENKKKKVQLLIVTG
jgi:hypothetical protein